MISVGASRFLMQFLVHVSIVTTCCTCFGQTLRPSDYSPVTVNLGDDEGYGTAMARAGDWLAVSAPGTGAQSNSSWQGGVTMWKLGTKGWQLKQRIKPANSSDGFGRTLVMDAGRMLIASAVNRWNSQERVFAFQLDSNGLWQADGEMTEGTFGYGYVTVGFGSALALSGDLAVLTAPDQNTTVQKAGVVMVYERQASGWIKVAQLEDLDADFNTRVGSSVVIAENKIFVGVPNARRSDLNPVINSAGKVIVFERNQTRWEKVRELKADSPVRGQGFGSHLKLSDGHLFVADRATSGKLYEYETTGEMPLVSTLSLPGLSNEMIWSVNGSKLAVGDRTSSSVKIYERQTNGQWDEHSSLTLENHRLERTFCTLLVGNELMLGGPAWGETVDPAISSIQGMVSLMELKSDQWRASETLFPMHSQRISDAAFGQSLAASDDWLVVGAPNVPRKDGSTRQPGLAYVYQKQPGGQWHFHSVLPDPVVGGGAPDFGRSIAISGSRIAVATSEIEYDYFHEPWSIPRYRVTYPLVVYLFDPIRSRWQIEQIIGGETYVFRPGIVLKEDLLIHNLTVYRRSQTGWSYSGEIPTSNVRPDELLGSSISANGNRLVVGAWQNTGGRGGAAYVFEQINQTWVQKARLEAPVGRAPVAFGSFSALTDDHLFVSAEGAAYDAAIYKFTGGVWKHLMNLPASGAKLTGLTANGPIVAMAYENSPLRLMAISGGIWKEVFDFPSPVRSNVTGLTIHNGELITGVTSATSKTVLLQKLTTSPTFTHSADAEELAPEAGASVLSAGEFLTDKAPQKLVSLIARQDGALPVLVAVSVSGDTADFVVSTDQMTVEVAKDSQLEVFFAPKSNGSKSLTVRLSPAAPGSMPSTYIIRAEAVSLATPLEFVHEPFSDIVPEGEGALFTAVSGTRPWLFRWIKNGRTLPKENASILTKATEGRYRLEVTNPAGKILSQEVIVGTYKELNPEQNALEGQTARLQIRVSDPKIKIRWTRRLFWENWVDVEESPRVTGTQSTILTLRNVTSKDSGDYVAILSLGDREVSSKEINLSVVPLPRLITDLEDGMRVDLGNPFMTQCDLEFYGWETGVNNPRYTITGLPLGLASTPSGLITGIPTRAGFYQVSLQVRVGALQSPVVKIQLLVTPNGLPSPGIYQGFVNENSLEPYYLRSSEFIDVTALATIELRPSGHFSGTLIGAGRRRLILQGQLSGSELISRPKAFPASNPDLKIDYLIKANFDGTDGLNFVLDNRGSVNGLEYLPLGSLKLVRKERNRTSLEPEKSGKRNFALMSSTVGRGHGFGSLQVDKNRRLTFMGQTSDGQGFTGTSWVYQDSVGADITHFYGSNGITAAAWGIVKPISTGTESTIAWDGLQTWRERFTDGYDASLRFNTSPQGRLKSILGELDSSTILPSVENLLALRLSKQAGGELPFRLSNKGVSVFHSASDAVLRPRLDLYVPTGFFTGSASIEQGPFFQNPTLRREVRFRGMLLPELGLGVGYFLWPGALSGSVEIRSSSK